MVKSDFTLEDLSVFYNTYLCIHTKRVDTQTDTHAHE